MIVVSDTTPLNYLVLVSKQDILPLLFGRVIVPEAVMRELQVAAAPPEVRHSDHRHSNATSLNATHEERPALRSRRSNVVRYIG